MSKFTVSYTRTVQTVPFENLKIGISKEFNTEDVPEEFAFAKVRDMVETQIDADLKHLGIKRRTPQ